MTTAKTIIVTGGAGFIGSAVVRHLINDTNHIVVNLDKLNIFESGSEVTPEGLMASGVVKSLRQPIKILAGGQINHPVMVKADKFSATARAKIEAAGGKVDEVEHAAKSK